MERLRNLLNSGVSLGELFATSTELRTTPKSTIDLSTGNFTLHQKEAIFLYQTTMQLHINTSLFRNKRFVLNLMP